MSTTALRVKAADASGGLDKYVGMPSHSNAHPLAKLDFVTVLQHLTAGVPAEPSGGVALLPLGASKNAPNALLAIQVGP